MCSRYASTWNRNRISLTRFPHDQLMNVGWKWTIPIALGCVPVNALIRVARG